MPDYPPTMVEAHRAVADAVGSHDPDGAEAALREHLRAVLREVPHPRTTPRLFRGALMTTIDAAAGAFALIVG